jgi:hypothetical protein
VCQIFVCDATEQRASCHVSIENQTPCHIGVTGLIHLSVPHSACCCTCPIPLYLHCEVLPAEELLRPYWRTGASKGTVVYTFRWWLGRPQNRARSRKKTGQLDTGFKTWVYWGSRLSARYTVDRGRRETNNAVRRLAEMSRLSMCLPNYIMEMHCILDCATIRKIAGLIPDGVIWIFYWHNPSSHTVSLGLTQSLTGMSTRNISWGGGWRRPVRRADNFTTFIWQLSWNLGASNSWNPQGLSRPVKGLLYVLAYYIRFAEFWKVEDYFRPG